MFSILLEIAVVVLVALIPYPVEAADKNLTAIIASIPALAWVGLIVWVFYALLAPQVISKHAFSADVVGWMEWARHHPLVALGFGPFVSLLLIALSPISWLANDGVVTAREKSEATAKSLDRSKLRIIQPQLDQLSAHKDVYVNVRDDYGFYEAYATIWLRELSGRYDVSTRTPNVKWRIPLGLDRRWTLITEYRGENGIQKTFRSPKTLFNQLHVEVSEEIAKYEQESPNDQV